MSAMDTIMMSFVQARRFV